jgi:hypothetical protein
VKRREIILAMRATKKERGALRRLSKMIVDEFAPGGARWQRAYRVAGTGDNEQDRQLTQRLARFVEMLERREWS